MKMERILSDAVLNKADTRRASRMALKFDTSKLIRMGFNEHPYGVCPNVLEAMQNFDASTNMYGDFMAMDLKKALADFYDMEINQVLPSAGSSALITICGTTFLNEGDEVLMCPTFAAFNDMAEINQATPVFVPLREDKTYDLNGLLDAVNENTKMVVICNPNNPTGTYVSQMALEAFIEELPDDVVLVMDEAYIEFATAEDCKSMYYMVDKYPEKPIVVLRTFSKYYGMAGARAGYALANKDIIAAMAKCPKPMVSRPAQAGAIEALKNQDYYQEAKAKVVEGINYLESELEKLGCTVYHSQTNFIMFNPHVDCDFIRDEVMKRGIWINNPMLNRVSVGTMEENEMFIKYMKDIMKVFV